MLQIGMTVKVLPDAEYGGKYTGCVGVVKNYYSSKKKAGVELEKVQNDASSKGLFWFSEDKLSPANNFLASVAELVDGMNCRCSSRLHRVGVPPLKKVIFSGPKTIDNCSKSVGILSDETIVEQHPWTNDVELELARLKNEKEEAMEQAQEYSGAFGAGNQQNEGMGGDE